MNFLNRLSYKFRAFLLEKIYDFRDWYYNAFVFKFEDPETDMICNTWKTRLLFYLFPFACSFALLYFTQVTGRGDSAFFLRIFFIPIYLFFDLIRAAFSRSIYLFKEDGSSPYVNRDFDDKSRPGYYDQFGDA